MKLNRKSNKGFTIIEVLIVLAIAATIMLIVLLAAPALQRSSRNAARKSDIGRIGAAVNEWVVNNSGKIFTDGVPDDNVKSVISAVGSLNQYTDLTTTNFKAVPAPSTGTPAVTALNIDESVRIKVVTYGECGSNGAVNYVSSGRQMALQYLLESGSTKQAYCQNI